MSNIKKAHVTIVLIPCQMSLRGEVTIPHSRMTKSLQGNIGNLFRKFVRHVTKDYLRQLLVASDYYVLYGDIAKGPSF